MKKKMTKKGWLLGVLVGLLMLVGVSPATAAGCITIGARNGYDNSDNNTLRTQFKSTGMGCLRAGASSLTSSGKSGVDVTVSANCAANNGKKAAHKLLNGGGWTSMIGGGKHQPAKKPPYMGHCCAHCSPVPIPAALWLFSSGLGLLFILTKKTLPSGQGQRS